MKTYVCCFECRYQVGAVAVIMADNKKQAKDLFQKN